MSLGLIVILLFSVIIHEYAHGYTADKLGDPTPRASGRLTLNPIAHIDPFGTILLPMLIFFTTRGAFLFGYAKPVPINPYHFKNPRRDTFLVSISGPLANILIALILTLILHLKIFVSEILIMGIIINLILAIFNLIPIPPLDGSRVVACLLPKHIANLYLKIEPYGFLIIVLLIATRVFNWFIFPAVRIIFHLLNIEVIL